MSSGERWRLGRRPALDGLRGVAILLVIAGHASHGWLHNFGSTGVTVFFALSGFLITTLLLQEGDSAERISLGKFYLRRARRLLPALAAYLAVMVTLSASGAGFFKSCRVTFADVWPVVLYVENWVMSVTRGAPAPVAITWSLSIEEQFYLLWPLVLIVALRWRWLPWVVCGAAVAYAVSIRLLTWDLPGASWNLYYRTDTHMDSLLIGCLLALAVARFGVPTWARFGVPVGAAVLVALLAVQSFWLQVAIEPAAAAVATCAVIGAVLAGSGRWLGWSPLRWVGRRSYALYLWHYPLAALAWVGVLPMWFAIGSAFVLAELSWWLVERPFQARRTTAYGVGAKNGLVVAAGSA